MYGICLYYFCSLTSVFASAASFSEISNTRPVLSRNIVRHFRIQIRLDVVLRGYLAEFLLSSQYFLYDLGIVFWTEILAGHYSLLMSAASVQILVTCTVYSSISMVLIRISSMSVALSASSLSNLTLKRFSN